MYQICEPKSVYKYCVCPCGKGSIECEREITNIEDYGWLAPSRKISFKVNCEKCKKELTYIQLTNLDYNLMEDPLNKENTFASDFEIPQYSSCYKDDLLGKNHHTLLIKEQLPDIVVKGITHRQYKCVCSHCKNELVALDSQLRIYRVGKSQVQFKCSFYCKQCWDSHRSTNLKAISSFEWTAMRVFRDYNVPYEAEYVLPINGLGGLPLRVDYIVRKDGNTFAIECNGEQHYEACDSFGGEAEFRRIQEHDRRKREYCKQQGMICIEIPWTSRGYDQIKKILVDNGIISMLRLSY